MIAGRAIRIAACLVVLASPVSTAGCSFIFVRGAKRQDPGPPIPAGCTTAKVAPTVDAILTGISASTTLFALTQGDAKDPGASRGADTVVAVGVVGILLFAASSMYGFATVGTCREVTGYTVNPYQRTPAKQTRAERLSDEAAEEAAVQARLQEKQAADAKAAGEAAGRANGKPAAAP